MTDRFYNELLNVLNNNEIKTMPDKSLISEYEDIALAVWKNFTIETEYEYDEASELDNKKWYKEGNWKEVLEVYKENIYFWKNAFSKRPVESKYEILLMAQFQEDFPIIKEYFLDNTNKLADLFYQSKNKKYFELIDENKEIKDKIYKKYIIDNINTHTVYISIEEVKEFENDKEFIKKVLLGKESYYSCLNIDNKLDNDFINIVIKKEDSIFELPMEKRKEYFPMWLSLHVNKKLNIDKFTEEEKNCILDKRSDLISRMLDKDFNAYKEKAIESLKNDFKNSIENYSGNQLMRLFTKGDAIKDIKPALQDFIINYKGIKEFSKDENKIISLVKLDKTLLKEINKNMFYEINSYDKSDRISREKFLEYFEETINFYERNEIKIEEANSLMLRLKNKLNGAVLKENKIPNIDVFSFLYKERLNKTLEDQLKEKDNLRAKHKI